MLGRCLRTDDPDDQALLEEDDRTSKLSFDELLTVLTEVETVLNSSPLSYVFSDDLEDPLTP